MKYPSQVFLKTIIPPEWFKLKMAYKSIALRFEKAKMEPIKTVSFHPAISFPPLYPRALKKGVWKIRKSGIWNPESGI